MTDMTLPTFLDRSLWSQEQHRASEAAWQKIFSRKREAAHYDRRRKERQLAAAKFEREQRAAEKAQRRQDREDRKARTDQRKADRLAVPQLIERGATTIGQMSEASGIPRERLKPAIRWLLRHGQLRKASGRTYKTIW